ncbi:MULTISPECIES: hypothetical protein [unclassified Micromonospora]|uniref:hypothetical protein n=1 Tax=unclassified Micromonospora TaxID=2617518 RepID=UPI002FF2BF7C
MAELLKQSAIVHERPASAAPVVTQLVTVHARASGVLVCVGSNGRVPKLPIPSLLYYLRFPLWVFVLTVLLFAGLPALMLAGQREFGAAILVLISNVYAINLGRLLLARNLLGKGRVKPEDLA